MTFTIMALERNIFSKAFRTIFALIDWVFYNFISILMQAIFDIANFTLSEDIFEKLIDRVYLILGIFMLFKLTISLLTYLVNPDKISDKENGIGKLSIRVILVLVMLIMIPSGFQLLNEVQNALLPSIPRLILNSNAGDSSNNIVSTNGEKIAVSIYGAFYYDNPECVGGDPTGITPYNQSTVTLDYMLSNVNLSCQTNNDKSMYQYEYTPVISTIAGGFMCYVLIGICITVAIRMFKMMILRMIAPIPIISYIDPKSSKDGAFSKWVKTLFTTWLELFINLGILYLIIFLIDKLLFSSAGQLVAAVKDLGWIRGSFFIVFIILGLFAFARQAPKFIMDALGIKNQGNFMRAMGLSSVALGGIGAGIGAAKASWKEGGLNKLTAAPRGLFGALGSIGAGGNALLSSDKPTISTGYDAQQKYNAQNLNYIRSGSTVGGRMGTRMQTMLLGQSEYDRMEIEWKEEEEKIKYDKQKNAERKAIMDRASSKGLESLKTSTNLSKLNNGKGFTGVSGRSYSFEANAAKFNSVYQAAMNRGEEDSFEFVDEKGRTFQIKMEDAQLLQHEINDGNIADYAEKALVGTIDDSVITGADARFASANNGVGVERTFGGSNGIKATYGSVNNDISAREMRIANEKNSDKAKRLQANKKNSN